MSLPDYLDAACEAARLAGGVIAEWRDRFETREKARFDLVTDADLASQRTIHAYLSGRFPSHDFLGEEDEVARARPGPDAQPTWIVDPIDGTTNYVHDFPLYCVSIGLEVAGDLVVGVVFDPVRGEMFRAAKGHGAWVGNKQLRTSTTSQLREALLTTGFPADPKKHDRSLDWWRYFSSRAQGLRRTGSTALNLAYVAAGRCDGYYAYDNHVWDVAAGVLLVREAGGVLTNADGSVYDPYTADAVASNGPLHPTLLQALAEGP